MKKTFSLWLSSRFFLNVGKQIQATVVAWQIFQFTHSPLALGLLGLAEAVPFVGIALWAGHLVDRNEKRAMILRAQMGTLIGTTALFLTTFSSQPPTFVFYVITAFQGLCSSFQNISNSAYAQMLIPKEKFPKAMGWNLALFQAALIGGPIAAGWLLSHVNARFIYVIAGILILISIFIASYLHPMHVTTNFSGDEPGWERIKGGLRFIRSQPLILSAMSLDMVAVLFGDVVALYPFFAERLHAGAMGFGVLKAAPSVGSGLVSAFQAFRPFVRPSWTNLRIVVIVFGLCMISFALSPNIYLAVFFLAIGGAVDGMSVIIRQTIYQALTPDSLRGRVASVSSMFIATSNQVGDFESGLAAHLIGVVPAVLFGGTVCLLSVVLMSRIFRGKIKASVTGVEI